MASLKFVDLSMDIQRTILDLIDRPTDLKNLCLTSKGLRELTTPILYRKIRLFVGGPRDIRLSSFLKENPGIPHVREVYLRLEKTVFRGKHRPYQSDDSSDEDDTDESSHIPAQRAQFTVRLLLDFLPANTLEVFSWQSWEPLSVDNFILLCKTQRKLRVLEIGPMDGPLDGVLEKYPQLFEKMTELNSIELYPDSVDKLKSAQRLLKSMPNIKHLGVSTEFEDSNEDSEDLYDSSTRPGLISRTLFMHMMPFDSCKPLILKKLDLDTVELRYAADTWLKVIKFSCLEKLEIRNCAGADAVFAQLSKPHLRPVRLRSLRWMDEAASESHALEAFEGLVEAIPALETLHVYINKMRTLLKVAVIIHHKKTLKSLSVHSQLSRDQAHTYSEADFAKICAECKEITQLSVMTPKVSIDSENPGPDFWAFMTQALLLPRLMTLNILRWPSTRDAFTAAHAGTTAAMHLYGHQLQHLSQEIFEVSDSLATTQSFGLGHRSRLAVVCWGGNGKTRYANTDKFKLKQIPFVRGWKLDPFGEKSLLAVQTVWRLVRFVEPESDILNHSLYDIHDIHHELGV